MKLSFNFRILLIWALVLTVSGSYVYGAGGLADPFANPADPPLDEARPDAPWITKWYALDGQITDNGGFAVSAPIDWIDEGTGGAITQETLSTMAGVLLTRTTTVDLPDNGGNLGWAVIEIDPTDGNNMSSMYGLPAQDNFDTYALIVIVSPDDRTTVMSPAHDDHAQIWINGEKCYNNSLWTGAAQQVDYDIDISLNRGANVLLYRCGESGGSDYFNLHLADTDSDLTIIPTPDGRFWGPIRDDGTAVEPTGKLSTTWADIKRKR